ncbi:hypothetical protein BAE44_0019928 [Dichanthelium oligosanthes]|uniref:Fungal lipase-like domain-containing protein n=1 Tax=Dichanthelium oligosanthes TaxID=888268 RepID=A0A1E5V1X5_9POAL|nr:hypothetical protein BAE44_0019928 [Dichanthelium oligosanthes]
MALSCAAECALSLACARWAARRLSLSGDDDSASWPAATPASFASVPRACRAVLAAYDDYQPAPPPSPLCPPYRLTHDRARREVVLAVRGLGLARPDDYRLLLDAGGPEPFAGGHAHRGLFRAAVWLLDREGPALRRMVAEAGPGRCRLVFVGHSLGAGVAALAAVVAVRCWLGRLGLRREDVRCYAMAPPRCMSLGLAVEYADVVHSVVLQASLLGFLPLKCLFTPLRTPAPLQHIFGSIFCLPCLLCFVCMRDTFVSEGKLRDPAKLYAPGTVFHIVERKNCRNWITLCNVVRRGGDSHENHHFRCGRFPPEVRTAVPTEGRFEHVVLSCNAAADHGIIWIEKEAQKALDLMEQEEESTSPPAQQKMLRAQEVQSIDLEEGTIGLHSIEHLVSLEEEIFQGNSSSSSLDFDSPRTSTTSCSTSSSPRSEPSEWDEFVGAFLGDHEHDDDLGHGNGEKLCNIVMNHLPFRCK